MGGCEVAELSTPTVTSDDLVPYPADYVARYRSAGLWSDRTIVAEFQRTAAQHPARPALRAADLTASYAELDAMTDRVASELRELGLRAGERVLLQLMNSGWAVVVWYGLLKAGLVPIATLPQHGLHELRSIAAQARPAAHIVQVGFRSQDLVDLARRVADEQPSLRVLLTLGGAVHGATAFEQLASQMRRGVHPREVVDAAQAGIGPDDLAVLQLSGGTTSVPKLIPRLHAEYWYNSRAYAGAIGLTGAGAVLHAMPLVHNAGIVCAIHAAHAVGACVAVGSYDPDDLRAVLARGPVTHMLTPPSLAQLLAQEHDIRASLLEHLQAIIWNIGPLTDEGRDLFETGSCRILQNFGMGEGLTTVTPVDAPAELRHQTIGVPVSPLDEVVVYRPGTEEPVGPGETGELCCRGPYTIRGYYAAPERNADAFTADGFYRSGDLVTAQEHDGSTYLRIAGRIKDVISRGGEKVNASEVEELLCLHASIESAAVVAMPDLRFGERACAFVVPTASAHGGLDLDTIRAHLRGLGVAKFKWPERIETVAELPHTNTAKVDKARLREQIAVRLREEQLALPDVEPG